MGCPCNMCGLSAAVSHSGKQTGDSRTALCSLCSALAGVRPGPRSNVGQNWNWILSSWKSSMIFRMFYHLSHFSLVVQLIRKRETWYVFFISFRSWSSVYPEPSGGCPHYPVALPVPLPIRAEKGYTEGSPYSAFLIPYFTVQNTLFLKESLYKGE